MPRQHELLPRHAIARQQLAHPSAKHDDAIHVLQEAPNGLVLASYEVAHPKDGPGAASASKNGDAGSNGSWQSTQNHARQMIEPQAMQRAAGAGAHVELSLAHLCSPAQERATLA